MTLPLHFIATELGLDGAKDAHEMLESSGAAFYTGQSREPLSSRSEVPHEDRILDCRAAHKPLVDTKQAEFTKIAIKGAI
jgi:hypothetical protein